MPLVRVHAAGEDTTASYTLPTRGPGPAVMPGPSNTGVPSGTVLRPHVGDITVTTAGTIIDGLDIQGYVVAKAANVWVRNCRIRGSAATTHGALVRCASAGASLTITDSELFAQYERPTINGLMGYNITAERLDIHHVIDPTHFYGAGNVRLLDSWLHHNLHYVNDPGWNGGPSHDDSIQIQSGSGYWIERNRIENSHNAAIMMTQDAGPISNVMIRDNYLSEGGVTINIAQKSRPPYVNVDILNNLFGPSKYGQQLIRPTVGDIVFSGNARVDGQAPKTVLRAEG